MKIEMCQDSALCVGWVTTALVLLLAALGGCHLENQVKHEAIKAGLVEKQNVGSCGTHWDKP